MEETPRKRRLGRPPGVPNRKTPPTTFAQRLYAWWQRSRMSQTQCAEYLGVSERTLQRWLAGHTPSTQAMRAIEKILPDGEEKEQDSSEA